MDAKDYCGTDLFADFSFEDIAKAQPPEKKGVYVIKFRIQGLPPDEIVGQLTNNIVASTGR